MVSRPNYDELENTLYAEVKEQLGDLTAMIGFQAREVKATRLKITGELVPVPVVVLRYSHFGHLGSLGYLVPLGQRTVEGVRQFVKFINRKAMTRLTELETTHAMLRDTYGAANN